VLARIILLVSMISYYNLISNLYIYLGDINKPKSWSKYAPDSTAYKKEHGIFQPEEVKVEKVPKSKKKSKLNSEIEEKLKQVFNLKL